MSRGLNWEKRASEERLRNATAPKPVYVRAGERSGEPWRQRYMRWPATCERCGDDIIKGERCWMLHAGRWRFRHEACHEP